MGIKNALSQTGGVVLADRYGLVKKYFQLDCSIEESKERTERMREQFYSSSMHTRMESIENGDTVVRGFRQDSEVVLFVDSLAEIERHIEKNNKKKYYLYSYLNTLPQSEKQYIHKRYVQRMSVPIKEEIEAGLINEIHEIEEAIQHMYGFKPEPKEIKHLEDYKASFNNILDNLGVL